MPDLRWFFDFHSHKTIRINHDPDVVGMANTMRECGIAEVTSFAKDHTGFAYYRTKHGTPHPRMRGDAFGDVSRACKEAGMRVLAYLSFGIDGEAARKHPEWARALAEGPEWTDDWYISVCPFTPYLDDLMLPMVEELATGYPIDGFFFDTMGAMRPCYCPWCEKEFRDKHGLAIPRHKDDPNWGGYGQFRHDRSLAMIQRVGDFIAARMKNPIVYFNQLGSLRFPERLPKSLNRLILDFTIFQSQSLQASLYGAFASMADRPAEFHFTIFNQGWGDWSPRPVEALEKTAVAGWARKNGSCPGDRLRPENRLDPISVRAMRHLSAVGEKLSQIGPDDDAELAHDILALHGAPVMYGEDMSAFALTKDVGTTEGCHRLLLDAGANFSITPEYNLTSRIASARLVITPEMKRFEPGTGAILKSYVENGGILLMTASIPKDGAETFDWLGIEREETPWQDHIYLPQWNPSEDKSPVLVRGDFFSVIPKGADVVLNAIRPYDCSYGVRFGWGIGPAETHPSDKLLLTRMKVGKGQAWYFAAPIFSCYNQQANWTQIDWFRGLLAAILPHPRGRAISKAGNVEIIVQTKQDATWAYLINHGGEQLVPAQRAWSRMFTPVPPFPTTVEIRDDRGRSAARVLLDGEPAEYSEQNGCVQLEIAMDSIWKLVRVDWENSLPRSLRNER